MAPQTHRDRESQANRSGTPKTTLDVTAQESMVVVVLRSIGYSDTSSKRCCYTLRIYFPHIQSTQCHRNIYREYSRLLSRFLEGYSMLGEYFSSRSPNDARTPKSDTPYLGPSNRRPDTLPSASSAFLVYVLQVRDWVLEKICRYDWRILYT